LSHPHSDVVDDCGPRLRRGVLGSGSDPLRRLARAAGSLQGAPQKEDEPRLAFELSGHLLEEVVAAGGGVEHAINQLRGAVADLTKVPIENSAKGPIGLSFPAATEALYAFGDVIRWARAVEERLDRRPPSRHSGKMRNQGLLPTLKPLRLKKRVEWLVKQLRAGPVGECRLLANFTLHAALARNPFAGAQRTADGAVTLPIPDPPAHPINHWYLFTCNDGRDGIAFAEEVRKSIQVFIDDLLNAFEKAAPKRLRPQKGP